MNFDNNQNDFYQRINDAMFPLLQKVEQNMHDLRKVEQTPRIEMRPQQSAQKSPLKITVFPFTFQGKKYLIEPSTNFVYLRDFTITPHIWNQKSVSITFIQDAHYDYEQDLY